MVGPISVSILHRVNPDFRGTIGACRYRQEEPLEALFALSEIAGSSGS